MTTLTSTVSTTCPTCAGWGVTGSAEHHGVATCPTCNGKGIWLKDDSGSQYSFELPGIIQPHTDSHIFITRAVRYGAVFLALAILLGSLVNMTAEATSLATLLWQRGLSHIAFGLSGLVVVAGVGLLEKRRGSQLSLADLPQAGADLLQYSHPRINELLNKAALTAQAAHDTTMTEAALLVTLLESPRIQSMIARLEHVPDDVAAAARGFLVAGTATENKSITLSPEIRSRLVAAATLAAENKFPYVDTEDILLAFVQDKTWFTQLFKQFDMTPQATLAIAKWYAEDTERQRRFAFWKDRGRVKPKGFMNRGWTALPTPLLDSVSRDLTSLAAQGGLAQTLVRDAEVERCLEVLGNPQSHNLLIVGEPGVGKSTILTQIAHRMVEERVPEVLRDHRLVELDLASVVAGQNSEQTMQQLLAEVAQAGNVILAIPEVQSLVGGGNGDIDGAAVLANAAKQGAVQVITTATYADFHRYVERNAQLANLLTIVEVQPTDIDRTIAVLEEEGASIEHREGVYLTYPAVEAAAELAEQLLTDRVLPHSAVLLLGDAASGAKAKGKKWVQRTDVEAAIEKRTGVPVHTAGAEEGKRLLNLENDLHSRIVGQNQAVTAVADALRRARAGLHTGHRPIASFLFVGPTGVGKTEMAKAIAQLMFGSEETLIRLDMSEYQDGTASYRLIGPPPSSSADFSEGGALTQPVREHPFCLILLDELEKAHPDVQNLFLQVLDDGRLTENTGRTVQYRNTIVIATSNASSKEIARLISEGIAPDQLSSQVLTLLQQQFKPEFLNRFDAIIPFHALTSDEAGEVTALLLKPVIATAAEQGIALSFTPEAVSLLTKLGYDPQFGGRPLRRVIQDKVEGLLAKQILGGTLTKGSSLQVTADMIQ